MACTGIKAMRPMKRAAIFVLQALLSINFHIPPHSHDYHSTFHYITVVKPFANTFSFCPIRVMHHCSTTRKMTPSSQSGHWISDGQSEPWRPAKT